MLMLSTVCPRTTILESVAKVIKASAGVFGFLATRRRTPSLGSVAKIVNTSFTVAGFCATSARCRLALIFDGFLLS